MYSTNTMKATSVYLHVYIHVCPFIAPHLSGTLCVCGHRFSPGWYCGSVAVK